MNNSEWLEDEDEETQMKSYNRVVHEEEKNIKL